LHPEPAVREVIVWPTVHNTLWQILDEESYNNLRNRLVNRLENKYEHLRNVRHPDDETLFVFTLYVAEGNMRHTFEFHVDDTMADTSLFVLEVVHSVEEVA
jgi:hypothetical protein